MRLGSSFRSEWCASSFSFFICSFPTGKNVHFTPFPPAAWGSSPFPFAFCHFVADLLAFFAGLFLNSSLMTSSGDSDISDSGEGKTLKATTAIGSTAIGASPKRKRSQRTTDTFRLGVKTKHRVDLVDVTEAHRQKLVDTYMISYFAYKERMAFTIGEQLKKVDSKCLLHPTHPRRSFTTCV